MTGFLSGFGTEISKNLADKWLSLLALPGALYLAVLAAARALGQAQALDAASLVRHITSWIHYPAANTSGGEIVLLAAVLAASVTIGLANRVLGSAIERAVLAADWRRWPLPARALASHRTQSRQKRWDKAHGEYSLLKEDAARALALNHAHDPGPRSAALRTRAAISAEYPDRPTWSGDRIHAVSVRLRRDHRIDLYQLWPHMWLVLPEHERSEIIATRTTIARATELCAWAVLYALPVFVWWPAGIIAALLGATGWRRTRNAIDGYAQLVESAVRMHAREVAQRLGINYSGPLPADVGDQLSELFGSAPPVMPQARPESGQPDNQSV